MVNVAAVACSHDRRHLSRNNRLSRPNQCPHSVMMMLARHIVAF